MNSEKKLPIWLQLTLGCMISVILIFSYNFNFLGELISSIVIISLICLYRENIKKFFKSLTIKKILKYAILGIFLGIMVVLGFVWYMLIAIIFGMLLYYFFSKIF